MKYILLSLFLILGCSTSKSELYESFQEGFAKGISSPGDCDDFSNTTFPEYYKACDNLCKQLYKEEAKCVGHISLEYVSCVCK